MLVLIAGDAISFLIAWELMSIASYLLVDLRIRAPGERACRLRHAGDGRRRHDRGGAGAYACRRRRRYTRLCGDLRSAAPALSRGDRLGRFLLSFFGFAVKAGLMPVNSWLPLAHPVAPTNVSALLSAVDRQSRHLRDHAGQSRPASVAQQRARADRAASSAASPR